jgi:serine/threonine protein kinase
MKKGSHNINDDICGKLFFNKYKPNKKLGEGSFGQIYSAFNVTNCEEYALKMVNTTTNNIYIYIYIHNRKTKKTEDKTF